METTFPNWRRRKATAREISPQRLTPPSAYCGKEVNSGQEEEEEEIAATDTNFWSFGAAGGGGGGG